MRRREGRGASTLVRQPCARRIQLSGLTHFLPNEGRGTLRGALFGWTHTDKFADIIDKAGLVNKCSVLCLAWAALNVTKASIREVRAVVAESIVDSRFRSQTLSTLLLLDRVLTTLSVALPLIVAYLSHSNGPLVTSIGGFVGLALGLGSQDAAKSFVAGVSLLWRQPFAVGDAIEIPSLKVFGKLLQFGIFNSVIEDLDGRPVTVPNAALAAGAVVNRSRARLRLCRLDILVMPPSSSQLRSFLEDARRNVGGSVNISSITCDGVGITAKVMVKNDATFDATKGDLYAKLLESAEKHEVELSFEKRIVLQPPASE